MKKFNEINGYGTIRCEAKVSTDKLKELHYKANDIIYKYNMQYAFPRNTQKAIDELSDVFVQIKELEVADAAKVKKEELLKQGRNIVTLLKEYIKSFKYDYALPVITNQKYNSYLKEIADICGIKKTLTTHLARHTAATLMLNAGIAIEVVSKILGHSNTKMTQHYAKLLDKTVINTKIEF